jgi:predicted nucleic acid-binding protein
MPEFSELRAYLDSNVLFSAAYVQRSRFVNLWRLRSVTVVTSQYAVSEVSRNIKSLDHRQRFEALLAQTQFVSDSDVRLIPSDVKLAAKDQPILAAAIAASVDNLVTGDTKHFGLLYGTAVSGVLMLNPAGFLRLHKERLLD